MTYQTSGTTRGEHLRIDGISKSYAGHNVLSDVTFTVESGSRAALIGENGSGKSTLLRIAAGVEEPDQGEVSAPPALGLFHQEPAFDTRWSVREVLDDAASAIRDLTDVVTDAGERLAETLDDDRAQQALARAIEAAEAADAWNVEHYVDILKEGLGLGSIEQTRQANELSGGQLARLSLAWTLIRRPRTLLLDEPSNHLDDRAVEVLAGLLGTWQGPVLFASHDRAFIDDVATDIIDLAPRATPHKPGGAGEARTSITRFTGSYSDYVHEQAEAQRRWYEQFRNEQEELKRLRAKVASHHVVGHAQWKPRSESKMTKKFYADRNSSAVSRRVTDAQRRLNELEESQVRKPPKGLDFAGFAQASFAEGNSVKGRSPRQGEAGSSALVSAHAVAHANRLKPVDFAISERSRLLITGPSGSGKSTLLSIIHGDLQPTTGELLRPKNLRVGMLTQEADADLPPHLSAREAYEQAATARQGAPEPPPLSHWGLIAGPDENRTVSHLSVGQRRRLQFAILLAGWPKVLILDEPTNHFSLRLSEKIEASLPTFAGAIIIASHDRWLRRRWQDEVLHLGD